MAITAPQKILSTAPRCPGGSLPDQGKLPSAWGPRGTTTIADRVVAKIAAQAASEIDHVGGRRRRLLGIPLPVGDQQRPHVDAQVNGKTARLQMSLGIEYPAPLRAITRQVRAATIARIHELARIEVNTLDITVVALAREDDDPRSVR